ncbi:unnamed protein product [Plutella xylostella]|uniref:(diamondback moth) hypothetical protein n=1 Tax=Plutella xylostella TaxID=51655 RepID=A0A8S4G749_PLUXY|nr:unnamed protein product [Plutella xylostella]
MVNHEKTNPKWIDIEKYTDRKQKINEKVFKKRKNCSAKWRSRVVCENPIRRISRWREKTKWRLRPGVLIPLIILNVTRPAAGESLQDTLISSLFGYPRSCTIGGAALPCTLSISCWLRGGVRGRGCGDGWLFSCCLPREKVYDEVDNSLSPPAWQSSPPLRARAPPRGLPSNVLRRRVDDDDTQADCGIPSSRLLQKRIIGGRAARFAEFPWQAHVRISEFQCGGVLVSRWFVATAAHCVSRARPRDVAVWLGALDPAAGERGARRVGFVVSLVIATAAHCVSRARPRDVAVWLGALDPAAGERGARRVGLLVSLVWATAAYCASRARPRDVAVWLGALDPAAGERGARRVGHLNDKEHILVAFIDYSKAFDTLKHNILGEKLSDCGIRGPLGEWCKNYLKERSFTVKVGDSLSKKIAVSEGTAQGSVLGPLHYITYVNDVVKLIKYCKIYQFADDTCLIAASKDIETALKQLQSDFTLLTKWSHDAGLVLNAKKTTLMYISSSQNRITTEPKLIVHNHRCLHMQDNQHCCCPPVEVVSKQKYLGLIFDDRLKWTEHINHFRLTQPDRYDIALLKLSRPVTYMSHILPICLPEYDLELRGKTGVIAGWGKTDASSGHTGTNMLRSASVPILSTEQCITWHQSKQISVEIHAEMICAGHSDGHQDACLGDSGGPLIVLDSGRYYLAGITSAGFGCGVDHQPGIYHNVKTTARWIRTVIGGDHLSTAL